MRIFAHEVNEPTFLKVFNNFSNIWKQLKLNCTLIESKHSIRSAVVVVVNESKSRRLRHYSTFTFHLNALPHLIDTFFFMANFHSNRSTDDDDDDDGEFSPLT